MYKVMRLYYCPLRLLVKHVLVHGEYSRWGAALEGCATQEQGEDGEEVEPHPLGNYLGEHWMKNSTSQESTPLRSTTST